MKLKLIILMSLVILIASFFVFASVKNQSKGESDNLKINTTSEYRNVEVRFDSKPEMVFKAMVSDTELLRGRGLSGMSGLKSDEAMLFVFDNSDFWGFWMKDMLFSIDILWLDKDYRVVSFENNVSPDSYPKIFFPKSESMYVLEFSAGTLEKIGVSLGDKLSIGDKK